MSNIKRYKYDWIWKKKKSTGFLNAKIAPLRNHEDIMVFYSSDIMTDTTLFFDKSKNYLISEKEKAEADGYNMREVLGNYMGSHYFTRKTQFSFPKLEDYEKLQTTGYFQREYDEAKREYDEARRITYNPQLTDGTPYKTNNKSHRQYDKGVTVYGKYHSVQKTNDGWRYPTEIIEFGNDNKLLHPTQKPVALLEYLIKTYTNEGETVLDPTMGSGSTGVACINTGRNFIGIEKDEHYFQVAKERIETAEPSFLLS